MEAVGLWDVVDEDHVFQVTPKAGQILDVNVGLLLVSAVLAIKFVKSVPFGIKAVHDGRGVAGHRGCEDDDFVFLDDVC